MLQEPLVGAVIVGLPPGLRQPAAFPGLAPPSLFSDVEVSLDHCDAKEKPEEHHDQAQGTDQVVVAAALAGTNALL